MEEENKKIPSGLNKLVITGKGRIIDGESDGSAYYAAVTTDLSIKLGGKDVTDTISRTEEWPSFIANKIKEEIGPADLYLSDEGISLPPSVFTLPEDFDFDKIEIIPVNKDFTDLKEGGVWVDFIIYDGQELEADTYNQSEYYGKYDICCNRDEYSCESFDEENETHIYRW